MSEAEDAAGRARDYAAMVGAAAVLQRRLNALWRRWCGGMREWDGVQVDVVRERRVMPDGTEVMGAWVFRAEVWGGASVVGAMAEVRAATREHIRRKGKRRASARHGRKA